MKNNTLNQVKKILVGGALLGLLFSVHPTPVAAAYQWCSCTEQNNFVPDDCSMTPGESASLREMNQNTAKFSWSCIGEGGAYCSPANAPSGANQDGYTTVSCVGTGQISISSNISGASWTVTGPATVSGSGTSQSASSEPLGTYTITWNPVAGYATPASQSQTIAVAGDTISFSGSYTSTTPSVNLYFN